MGESTCDRPCAGDDSQTCGGYNAISLYEYATRRYRELGCFVDDKHDRVFSGISRLGDPTMTTEVSARDSRVTGATCRRAAEYIRNVLSFECALLCTLLFEIYLVLLDLLVEQRSWNVSWCPLFVSGESDRRLRKFCAGSRHGAARDVNTLN